MHKSTTAHTIKRNVSFSHSSRFSKANKYALPMSSIWRDLRRRLQLPQQIPLSHFSYAAPHWRKPWQNCVQAILKMAQLSCVPSDGLQAFASEQRRAIAGLEVLLTSYLRQTSGCVTQLLITAPGVATRTQLNQLGQTLALQGTPLAGWVFLDPALSV